MYLISLDLGSTNTKTIIENVYTKKIICQNKRKSSFFDKMFTEIIRENEIKLEDINVLIVTGTGASYLGEEYQGIKIFKVNEFDAVGLGGLKTFNIEEAIVVSIGTGTSFVHSTIKKTTRLGGTGIGGGTFIGLCGKLFPGIEDAQLIKMAEKGNAKNVDLLIGDVTNENIDGMNQEITAANFGATYKQSNENDNVSAVLNIVVETVTLMASVHKKALNNKHLPIIFVGMIANTYFFKKVIKEINSFTYDEYLVDEEPEFSCAKGALEYYKNKILKIY